MTLIYSFIFSVPNIVDPKSLALLDVSPSRFLDGWKFRPVCVFKLVDQAIKDEQRRTLAASRRAARIELGWVSFPDSSIIHVCCT